MQKGLDQFKVRAWRWQVQFILVKQKLIKVRANTQIGKKVMNCTITLHGSWEKGLVNRTEVTEIIILCCKKVRRGTFTKYYYHIYLVILLAHLLGMAHLSSTERALRQEDFCLNLPPKVHPGYITWQTFWVRALFPKLALEKHTQKMYFFWVCVN